MAKETMLQLKSLRTRTGAGMMDCKKALAEAGGDEEKAVELIQKKGLAKAAKRAGAIAAEGVVHSYIHAGGRLGVLVEINCQTDFVAMNEDFKAFSKMVGLQIASMAPEFVRREDVSEEQIAAKRQFFLEAMIEEEKETGKAKPESAKERILDGKVNKWLSEACLLDQVSILAEGKKTFHELTQELGAKTGEKISIRRFVRYELGEGIKKKKHDLAADVAETLAGA